jgi:hypothetical protein
MKPQNEHNSIVAVHVALATATFTKSNCLRGVWLRIWPVAWIHGGDDCDWTARHARWASGLTRHERRSFGKVLNGISAVLGVRLIWQDIGRL